MGVGVVSDKLVDYGYATGNYSVTCVHCTRQILADKRATSCAECAAEEAIDAAVESALDEVLDGVSDYSYSGKDGLLALHEHQLEQLINTIKAQRKERS